jgi:cytochrome c553
MRSVLLLAVVACTPSITEPPKAPEPIRVRDRLVRFHMNQNYDFVRAIERLLIRGRLADAKYFAEAIATAPDEPGHDGLVEYTVGVRERASAIAGSKTLEDAIRHTAQLGAACGNCHGKLAIAPRFGTLPPVPIDLPTVEARMLRHRWAADRLWEGVVGNSDVAWAEGLEVLATAPLDETPERTPLAYKLYQQAREARKPSAGTLTDRGSLYGEILVTCASCHTQR